MFYLYKKKDNKLVKLEKEMVLISLYLGEAIIPLKEHMKGQQITADENKMNISKIDNKIPLYDEMTRNMFLIDKDDVYSKVVYESYRFPELDLIKMFKKKRVQLKGMKNKDKLQDRELNKLGLMLDYLNMFDVEILENTYMKVFYESSIEGNNITVCVRPSFDKHLTHINPYYTKSELINMALNMDRKIHFEGNDKKDIMNICNMIQENDVHSDILIRHQEHIIKNKMIGLVRYYSLQGSYFINKYMRGLTSYSVKNIAFEENIRLLWNLVKESPSYDKSYIFYRFINSDNHLSHLKIGQIYTDSSFMSTTRDPFYRSDEYDFGFILLKIKVPKGIKGVGLCIETFSNFKKEQEIIMPPLSKFRLDGKDKDIKYYHTDKNITSNIRTRYEFTYIGNEPISFTNREHTIDESPIDFINIDRSDSNLLKDKIDFFTNKYVNQMDQFNCVIGDKTYTVFVEWYDSTGAYKRFYAATTDNGFSMYTLYKGDLLFFIELNEINGINMMHVNYYFKFSTVSKCKLKDDDLLLFICKIAYYYGINTIKLYTENTSCGTISYDGNDIYKLTGDYCIDYYNYFKDRSKRFSELTPTEIRPGFAYFQLDRLCSIKPLAILNKMDRDPLYQIYEMVYIDIINNDKNKDNIGNFYVWLVDNYCIYSEVFVNKVERLKLHSDPFKLDHYIVNPNVYLYNRGIISNYKINTNNQFIDNNRDQPKNTYRLDNAVFDR